MLSPKPTSNFKINPTAKYFNDTDYLRISSVFPGENI